MELSHFPSWWNIQDDRLAHVGTQQSTFTHGFGRALFGDWSRIGNINVAPDNKNIRFDFQFEGDVSFRNYADPFYVEMNCSMNKDSMKTNPDLFLAQRKVTLNKYRHLRQITSRGLRGKQVSDVTSYIKSVRNNASTKRLNKKVCRKVPLSFIYAGQNYSSLMSAESISDACKTDSPMYCGGCITIFILEGVSYLARSTGTMLSNLQIDAFDAVNNTLTQVFSSKMKVELVDTEVLPLEEGRPIYEIDSVVLNEVCRLLVRRANELRLFIVRKHGKNLSVDDIGEVTEGKTLPWLCARMNRCWKEELVGTSTDMMTLYDVATIRPSWRMKVPCLSSVVDSWNEVQSFLPMQWLYTNRAKCLLIDCRCDPMDTAKELFSTSHETLNRAECFSHTSSIFDSHYFYLFSSFNSNLIDIRMPGKQVSQWSLPLLSPISYSSITRSQSSFACVIGSQLNARHCIFEEKKTSHYKTTALRSRDTPGQLPMSLGLVSIEDDEHGLTKVLTLDYHGRLLCHQYINGSYNDAPMAIYDITRDRTYAVPISRETLDSVMESYTFGDKYRKADSTEKNLRDAASLTQTYEDQLDVKFHKNDDVFNT